MTPNPYESPSAPSRVSDVVDSASRSQSLLAAGISAMTLALMLQNVTLTDPRQYAWTLLMALGLTMAADACLAAVIWGGGTGCGIAAIVVMLPTVYVLAEFMRRAPHIFMTSF